MLMETKTEGVWRSGMLVGDNSNKGLKRITVLVSLILISILSEAQQPVANFACISAFYDSANGWCCLQFQDLSSAGTGTIVSWQWNFGNGISSGMQNPIECLFTSGVYFMCLIVTNSNGFADTLCKAVTIVIDSLGCHCDSLTEISEFMSERLKPQIYPNPVSDNQFTITYLLPQNKTGLLEVFNITGRRVVSYVLPPWSTLQKITLPVLAKGVYACRIRSGGHEAFKKIVIQ
jgi:PKD repeat protein